VPEIIVPKTKELNESVMDRRLAHLNEAIKQEVLAILNDASVRISEKLGYAVKVQNLEFRIDSMGAIHVRKRK